MTLNGQIARMSPGVMVADRYTIKKEMGKSGLGIVYLAQDQVREKDVAIKVIPPELIQAANTISYLKHELATALEFVNPQGNTLYSLDIWDGHVLVVMEYAGSETLAHLLEGEKKFAGVEGRKKSSNGFLICLVVLLFASLGVASWLLLNEKPLTDQNQTYVSINAHPQPAPVKQETNVPVPGQTYTDSITGMEFVFVDGGCYQMGDTFGEGDANERPVHEVCVGSFWMGKYEVTQREYQKIIGSNPSTSKRGSNYPVETVSWDDVHLFISKLNSRASQVFRLPTEAEWEFAARERGRNVRFGTGGNAIGSDEANFDGTAENKKPYSRAGEYREYTTEVGSFAANSLGFYDMSGNVWEWCSDLYGKEYYMSSPVNNPKGPSSGLYRVNRGGSWDYYPEYMRSTYRSRFQPSNRNFYLGFRLVFPGGSR